MKARTLRLRERNAAEQHRAGKLATMEVAAACDEQVVLAGESHKALRLLRSVEGVIRLDAVQRHSEQIGQEWLEVALIQPRMREHRNATRRMDQLHGICGS